MKHLISPLDLSVEELDQLLDLAQDIEANPQKYAHACDGKKLATLFYEPSTRTRLSHEAAMLNLGGSVWDFPLPTPALHQKVRAFLIPSVSFPAMQTSVPCVTQKKEHRSLQASILLFRSSMPVMADTSIQPRR